MKKINVGMIGSGFAAHLHAESYRRVCGLEACMYAVSSVAPDAEAFAALLLAQLAPGERPVRLTSEDEVAIRALADEKYRAWTWTCGRSPAFEHEAVFLLGNLPVTLKYAARRGVIESIAFDARLPALDEAARRLTGAALEMNAVRARLEGLDGLETLWRELF